MPKSRSMHNRKILQKSSLTSICTAAASTPKGSSGSNQFSKDEALSLASPPSTSLRARTTRTKHHVHVHYVRGRNTSNHLLYLKKRHQGISMHISAQDTAGIACYPR
ncbi:uncharacterized protein DMAD_05273 [Drosophila madeirensis]|uniref:Uncharacterized protein n=1 Tax=Drosophila madeirensis TaxID=30013 RepID=A0AAU9FM39_DROMD